MSDARDREAASSQPPEGGGPSRPFIIRPIATSLLMVAIVLAGLLGLQLMPLSALPQVDYPTIQVQTLYPGASPNVMARTVTAPLERQFGQMAGLARMASTSSAGASVITLQFDLALNMDVAQQEVQAAMNAASALLPLDLPAPPVYALVNPADAPVLTLAVTSDTMPLTDVYSLINTQLAQKISQVSGVGLVTMSGGQRPAVRIDTDAQAIAAMGLSLSSVLTAITNANANAAKGSIDGPLQTYAINANDQLVSASEYQNLVVAYRNGAPVRLSSVAKVSQSAENVNLGAWSGLTPAIVLNVQRQPGSNVIRTVDSIKQLLPGMTAGLPGAVKVAVLADSTTAIRASVRDVEFELLLAVALVVAVIFLFLRSLRATAVASLAVPVSLIGTMGVTYLLGYSLNNLSLMALTIATGFVVDDAIVMLENISRHVEEGATPFRAALDGARQIGFTIISLTVSLIAVLIPLLFMQQVVGRLFREFAVTLAITILISAVVSLTLTPMLAARWLTAHPDEEGGAIGRRAKAIFDRLLHRYDLALTWVLDRQRATLIVAVATFVLTVLLYVIIPKGLFPTQDTGQLQGHTEAPRDVSYPRMARLQQAAARAILQDPAVQNLASFVGVDASNNSMLNTGSMLIDLKPNHGDQVVVMQRLRDRVAAQAPGIILYLQPTQDLTLGASTGPTQYGLSLQAATTSQVNDWAARVTAKLRTLPQLQNVVTMAGATGTAAYIDVNRDTAARLGISAAAIDDTLYSAFGQRIVSTIFTESSQYRVILNARQGPGMTPRDLGQLRLVTASGLTTPLSAFATLREQPEPLLVTHVAQFPGADVGFDTPPGVALGTAVQAVRQAMTEIGIPPSVTVTFLGSAGAYGSSLSNELWLILAAVVCVYIVLGVLYESYVHPLTILSTLPSAGVGALLALMITGHPLDVIAIIGIILLIGIVKKNAIMMIDFAINAEREQGMSARDAIHRAALLRFRPILMTTMAALFAAMPLMLSTGVGAELRQPLGLAIFGGLILSQLLTVFTTPVIYLAFDRLAPARRQTGGAAGEPAPEPAE